MKNPSMIALATATALLALGTAQADDSGRHIAQSLANAKVSLTEAIRAAEKEGNGQAVSAEYEFEGGNPAHYEVKVLRSDGDKLMKYELSPSTGKVKDVSDAKIEKLFTRVKPESIRHSPTSLTHAITSAEQRAGGKAIEADVDRDGDQVQYTVKVVRSDGTTEKMKINGADGKVASAK